MLSLYDNQLLVGSLDKLYIYNTSGTLLCPIHLSNTLLVLNILIDAAWISRNQILYTTNTGLHLITLPSGYITALRIMTDLSGISVSDGVIYVCTQSGNVLTSSDGGVTWSNMLQIKLDNKRESVHVIRIPGSNSTHTDVYWVRDVSKENLRLLSDTRVLMCHHHKSAKISVSCREVFRVNASLARLAYDGQSAMLLTDSATEVIHVFDVSGRYNGQLKLLGAKLTSGPTSMTIADGVLYVGLEDGSVMVFRLV